MSTPLQDYRKATYDRTIEQLLLLQEQKKSWLDSKLRLKTGVLLKATENR